MAHPSGQQSSSTTSIPEEFGANEWLVEEMKERFEADPASVDPAWAQYFRGNGGNGGGGNGRQEPKQQEAQQQARPAPQAEQPLKQQAPQQTEQQAQNKQRPTP